MYAIPLSVREVCYLLTVLHARKDAAEQRENHARSRGECNFVDHEAETCRGIIAHIEAEREQYIELRAKAEAKHGDS